MEKMKMHSPNLTQENIARIRELFPGCVTEAKGEDGQLKLAMDFDQLRQELSESIVEGPQERYHLNWPGKREALLTANAPIARTLRPCREESVDFDTTKNLFIEGDNLEALKLLQETYLGKVKMIYIDPPYNTGNDFIYKDDFRRMKDEYLKESGQIDEEGNRLVANTEANGRFHSDWLSMIYPRLKLARNLLRDDGVIFISVDDSEYHNLKKIADEIFGEANNLGTIVWKKKTNGNNMGYIPPVHDYFLSYGKNASDESLLGFPLTDEFISKTYANPDNDPRGPWTTSDLSANHVGPYFEIANPETGDVFLPPKGRYWVFGEADVKKRIADGRIIFGKSGTGRPIQKKFLNERISMRRKAESWWDNHGMNEDGTSEISELIAAKAFTHPKPSITLKHLSNICTQGTDVILDFFAGSATTAHAVMQLNAEDGGNRKFILVQLPEACDEKSEAFKAGYKTIAEISKERIRRAGKKVLEEMEPRNTRNTQKKENQESLFGEADPSVSSVPSVVKNLDIGFRVLKIDSSNMAEVYYTPDAIEQGQLNLFTDNIKPDRTPEDLLFQVLLDWGVDLSLPIRKTVITTENTENTESKKQNHSVSSVSSVVKNSFEVFFVDDNALVACFDTGVNEDLVKELAQLEPLRVVFRDTGFVSDAVKINVEQIFKQMSPGTDVKSI